MDLTTLAAAVLLALGLLSADAIMHSDNVVVEVIAPPRSDKISIDEVTLELAFEGQLRAIANTDSLVLPPEIRVSRRQGVGMALAEAARVQGVAYALQSELGYTPDRLRFALYVQNGAVRGLISGSKAGQSGFEQVLTLRENEALPDFVRRAALWGVSRLAPYTTALYLVQLHSEDKDFADVLALIDYSMAKLPPTPISFQRSLFQNLRGIIALFQDDPTAAKAAFTAAAVSDPSEPAATLNQAFVEVQINEYPEAARRMQQFINEMPTGNNVLRATAYMTWAAAEMGVRNWDAADRLLAKAMQLYPTSSTGYDLWAEAKDHGGDRVAAEKLRRKALASTSDAFENYAEVAALYFHLSWQDDKAVVRNKFASPPAAPFR